MSKFDELKKLAELATPGPWAWDGRKVDEDGDVFIPECSYIVGNICLSDSYEGYAVDCDYIAAANPAAILELLAIQAQLVEALSKSKRYVSGAYECAFPDEGKNAQVLSDIDAALAAAGAQS